MVILSYALCGFAHVASVGIFVGGISAIVFIIGIFVFIGLLCVAYLTIQLGKVEFLTGGKTESFRQSPRARYGLIWWESRADSTV